MHERPSKLGASYSPSRSPFGNKNVGKNISAARFATEMGGGGGHFYFQGYTFFKL